MKLYHFLVLLQFIMLTAIVLVIATKAIMPLNMLFLLFIISVMTVLASLNDIAESHFENKFMPIIGMMGAAMTVVLGIIYIIKYM